MMQRKMLKSKLFFTEECGYFECFLTRKTGKHGFVSAWQYFGLKEWLIE